MQWERIGCKRRGSDWMQGERIGVDVGEMIRLDAGKRIRVDVGKGDQG